MDLQALSEADLIRRVAECDERAAAYRGELARRQAARAERAGLANTLIRASIVMAAWLTGHWPKS